MVFSQLLTSTLQRKAKARNVEAEKKRGRGGGEKKGAFQMRPPSSEGTAYASKGFFFHYGPADAADAVCLMPMRAEEPGGGGGTKT